MAKMNDFNFQDVIRKISKDRTLPRRIGTMAVNHFKKSFRNQGFTDRRLTRWPNRKRGVDPGRAILVKSGDLRRSISIRSANMKKIVIGTTGVPYAAIHNNGGRTGRAFMPKRQFIGESEVLQKKVKKRILRHIKKAF